MFEGTEERHGDDKSEGEVGGLDSQPDQGGVPGAEAGDIAGEDVEEGAGDRKAAASPEIGEDANKGETQHPAPDDEVGVPENPGGSGDEG